MTYIVYVPVHVYAYENRRSENCEGGVRQKHSVLQAYDNLNLKFKT